MMKYIILSIVALMTFSSVSAQDDLYFAPRKKLTKEQREAQRLARLERTSGTYYCGSDRNVDEYNRRGAFSSHYEVMGTDSTGNDVITFIPGDGTYPDSINADCQGMRSIEAEPSYGYDEDDDYRYSRRMMVYDGFYSPYFVGGPYFCSPWHYRYNSWYWNDPWYWGSAWCWNDPWYWRSSWYWNDPWCWYGGGYWGHYWGHYPHYIGVAHRINPGTSNHGNFSGRRNASAGTRSIARGVQNESNTRGKIYNKMASSTGNFTGRRGKDYSNNRTYDASRSSNFNNSRSTFSGGGFSNGGGLRGGGFSNGSGSRGGGGHFGGRR